MEVEDWGWWSCVTGQTRSRIKRAVLRRERAFRLIRSFLRFAEFAVRGPPCFCAGTAGLDWTGPFAFFCLFQRCSVLLCGWQL